MQPHRSTIPRQRRRFARVRHGIAVLRYSDLAVALGMSLVLWVVLIVLGLWLAVL